MIRVEVAKHRHVGQKVVGVVSTRCLRGRLHCKIYWMSLSELYMNDNTKNL